MNYNNVIQETDTRQISFYILSVQCKHFYTSPLLPSAVQGEIGCDFFVYCAFIYVIVVLVTSFSS